MLECLPLVVLSVRGDLHELEPSAAQTADVEGVRNARDCGVRNRDETDSEEFVFFTGQDRHPGF